MSKTVARCKFKLTSIKQVAWSPESRILSFDATYDDTIPEDVSFSKATPSGQLDMTCSNPNVYNNLVLGEYYYLDLIQAADRQVEQAESKPVDMTEDQSSETAG